MAIFRVFLIVCCVFWAENSAYAGFTTTKIGPQPIWNSTHTDKLRQDLLLNYDKFARPAQHYNVTTVRFGLTIRHIELNEFKSALTVSSWIRLTWKDEKLKWNSSNYGGLSVLNLADHEIWQPDIFLYNSATSTAITHYGNVHCLVYENGDVLWVPPAQFTVLCNLNLKFWPFDSQSCQLIFGSWTYNGDQIDIELINNETKVDTDLLVANSEWDIEDTALSKNMKYYPCCPSPYPDVTVDIVINRISPSYKAIIVTPAFVIITLILTNFWLPPQAGEKIVLNGCTALIICLFLLYFSQKIPAMGVHTPLIVLFYSNCLYVVTFSIVTSVFIIWLSRTKHNTPLPWTIKNRLNGTLGKILLLNIQQSSITSHRVTAEEMRDHQVTDFEENNSGDEHHIIRSSNQMPIQHDWIMLATALDRLIFAFLSFLSIILLISYSV